MRRAGVAVIAFAAGAAIAASAAGAGNRDLSFAIGKALFERAWVPAPSSTRANDGLGPVFNARACSACHQGLDRAQRMDDGQGGFTHPGMVLKLSDARGAPDPLYGAQLQTAAIAGFVPEGRLVLSEGDLVIGNLGAGPLAPSTHMGLRAAPALRGLGLLASVPDEEILSRADPDDEDGDGVSGRANWVFGADGRKRLGRFGLKASGVTLAEQTEAAFFNDLGMSTPGHSDPAGDCRSQSCRAGPHGGTEAEPEIRGDLVAMLADYLARVPPPAAAKPDGAGEKMFVATGCSSCHVPTLTAPGGEVPAYSDLLLHDLGPGLDGGATEPGVQGGEWRTAPLWGLSRALGAKAGLLHDGRASDVAEAIAHHGGEGAGARARFQALTKADRATLLRYVEGL